MIWNPGHFARVVSLFGAAMTCVSFFLRRIFFVSSNLLCVYLSCHLQNYIAILLVLLSRVLPRKRWVSVLLNVRLSLCFMCEYVLGFVGDVRSRLTDV